MYKMKILSYFGEFLNFFPFFKNGMRLRSRIELLRNRAAIDFEAGLSRVFDPFSQVSKTWMLPS